MKKHPFDAAGRISAEELRDLELARWQPPRIDAKGHLIPVQPRRDPSPRETPAGEVTRPAAEVEALSDEERRRAAEQGHAEGVALGRTEGLEQGRKQGLEQGLKEGREQGLAEARAELDRQLTVINRLATSLTHALNEEDYQLEQALLNLVREITRQVIQRELQLDNTTLMPVVRQALKTLPPGADNVRILVNPDDLPVLEQAIAEGGENWRALARRDVAPGGCRIETDQSVLDFTTGHRFRSIMEQVVGRQLRDAGAPEEPFEEAPEPFISKSAGDDPEEYSGDSPGRPEDTCPLSAGESAT